jgi:hypothetical protein
LEFSVVFLPSNTNDTRLLLGLSGPGFPGGTLQVVFLIAIFFIKNSLRNTFICYISLEYKFLHKIKQKVRKFMLNINSYDGILWEKKETYCHSQPADAIALEISLGEPVAH